MIIEAAHQAEALTDVLNSTSEIIAGLVMVKSELKDGARSIGFAGV